MTLEQLAERLHMAWELARVPHAGRRLSWEEIGQVERAQWVKVARCAAHELAAGVSSEIAAAMGWLE